MTPRPKPTGRPTVVPPEVAARARELIASGTRSKEGVGRLLGLSPRVLNRLLKDDAHVG